MIKEPVTRTNLPLREQLAIILHHCCRDSRSSRQIRKQLHAGTGTRAAELQPALCFDDMHRAVGQAFCDLIRLVNGQASKSLR